MMCLWASSKKKNMKKIFFCIFKVNEERSPDPLVKGTVRRSWSGSIPKCHGSQHWLNWWRGKSGGGHTSGRIRGAAGRGGQGATHGRQQVHRLLPRVRGPRSQSRLLAKGLQRDVVYLRWPIASSVYESQCGGIGGVAGPQPMSTASCAHHVTLSLNKLWRSTSIFNLWFNETKFALSHFRENHLHNYMTY